MDYAALQAARATANTWQFVPEIREAIDAARPDDAMAITAWDWAVIVAYGRKPREDAQEAAQRIARRARLSKERYGQAMSPVALLGSQEPKATLGRPDA